MPNSVNTSVSIKVFESSFCWHNRQHIDSEGRTEEGHTFPFDFILPTSHDYKVVWTERWEKELVGERLGGVEMDCEVCIMQLSGHPSVNCAPHNRWQTHLLWVPAW